MDDRAATAPPHRYVALDSLRGVCALCVCLFHFRANGPIATLDFVRGSWLFVDFFFVLSGFVIAANYRDRLMTGGFLRRFVILRLGRIYPLHLVMLLAFVGMELIGMLLASKGLMQRRAFDTEHSVVSILTNLTLTQAFGLHPTLTWNQPSWSIAVEFWTYLLFALAAVWAAVRLEAVLVVVMIACAAVLYLATPYGINVSHSWSLFRCVYGFAVGALVWWFGYGSGRPAGLAFRAPGAAYRGGAVAELGVVAAVAGFVALAGATHFNLLAPLVFGGAVLVFAHEGGPVSRALMTAPLRRLGALSYSIYMVHTFVQARMDDGLRLIGKLLHTSFVASRQGRSGMTFDLVGATPVQGVLLTAVMLALVIGVAALTWRLVEMPCNAAARRLAR